MLDYHVILDLVPTLANLYFSGRLRSDIKLTGVQQGILLSIGLQHKDMDEVAEDFTLPSSQLLAMFIKILRKMTSHFGTLVSASIESEMPKADSIGVSRENATGVHEDETVDTRFAPLETSLEDELEEGGDEALREVRKKQRELIDSLPLDQYEIEGDAPGWQDAEKQVLSASKQGKANPVVSVKSSKTKRKAGQTAAEVYEEVLGEKSHKKHKKSKK